MSGSGVPPADQGKVGGSVGQSSGNVSAGGAGANSKPAGPTPPRPIPTYLRPLRFVGVPRAVLTWQPKLPSRNWSIFWGVTITLTSLYVYDRRECKRIRQEYVSQLEHLAQEPLLPRQYPRKLQVLTAKSPGDEDPEKSLLFFKLYVKPFLVAAGIDWTTCNGVRHGGLARDLRERHYARRRQLLGLEPWGMSPSSSSTESVDPWMAGIVPFSLTPQEQLEHELDGGLVIVGRPALKEWAWGLREGWTTRLPPKRQDLEEEFALTLTDDGAFDEEEEDAHKNELLTPLSDGEEPDGAGAPLPSRLGTVGQKPLSFNPAFQQFSNSRGSSATSQRRTGGSDNDTSGVDPRLLEPPSEIPAQPPITFVDYTNLTGFKNVPRKIVGFFRHRDRFELGGQAALNVALGRKSDARELDVVRREDGTVARTEPPQGGDLDWGLASERFYPSQFARTLQDVEKERMQYYNNLKQRLKDTRTYVRGERELTATERNNPPTSEGDLRQERFRKERDWALLTQAFNILRSEAGVVWHPSFAGRLRVFQEQVKRPVQTIEETAQKGQ